MPGALPVRPSSPAIHDGNPDQPALAYQRPLDGQGLGLSSTRPSVVTRVCQGLGLSSTRPSVVTRVCQGLGLSSTRPSVVTRVWKDG